MAALTILALAQPAFSAPIQHRDASAFPQDARINWRANGATGNRLPGGFTTPVFDTEDFSSFQITAFVSKSSGFFERRKQGEDFFGGFERGEELLWNGGEGGAIRISFSEPVVGVGMEVTAVGNGVYEAILEAFDADGRSLGVFSNSASTVPGDHNTAFIGAADSRRSISFVTVEATDSIAVGGPLIKVVPEPATALLLAISIAGLAAIRRAGRTGLLAAITLVASSPSEPAYATTVINNGLAPPNPENVIDFDDEPDSWLRVLNSRQDAPTEVLYTWGASMSTVTAEDDSTLRMNGGAVNLRLMAWDESTVIVEGGTILVQLGAANRGRVTLRGGGVGTQLTATDGGVVTIFGSDFAVDGVAVPFGPITSDRGLLTGTLESGEPVDASFQQSLAGKIVLVPEPSAGLLTALGLLGLTARRRAVEGVSRSGYYQLRARFRH